MKYCLVLTAIFLLFSSVGRAQNYPTGSALHTQGLVLDDGNGHTYSLFVPPLQKSAVFFLPVLPDVLPTAGYVSQGLAIGQTLMWNGSAWLPSDALINDGVDLTASGIVHAADFYGSGLGLSALDAAALSVGFVPLGRLSGITSAQLAPNAGIQDAQIVSLSASKLIGSLPTLDGSSVTNIKPQNILPGTATIDITGNAATATTATNLSGSISESQVLGLSNDLFQRAFDAQVVHLTQDEVIGGNKTFSNPLHADILGNAATSSTSAQLTGTITESQVQGLTADLAAKASATGVVHTTTDESISGTKTFTTPIAGSITGNAATATTATNLSGSINESQVTGLTADLTAKAIDAGVVHNTGNESVAGIKTFASPIVGSITGNAATATTATNLSGSITESQVTGLTADLAAVVSNSGLVHTTGNESIAGIKTFASPISGSVTGNAATATNLTGSITESQVTNLSTDLAARATDANVVHLTGAESIAGPKTFTSPIAGSITGSASSATTATNLTGSITESQVTNLSTDLAARATDANVVHLSGTESIGGVKTFTSPIAGSITGSAASATTATNLTGSITESQVTNLATDLAARATDANVVHLTGTESIGGTKTFTSPIAGSITGSAASAATATNLTGSITESQVTNLITDLTAKATDANVVHLTGAETVAGSKTFSSPIVGNITGNAATATSATTITGSIPESQVTNLVADLASHPSDATLVHNTGNETIAGTKTFSSQIVGSISGNAATSSDGLTSASGTLPLTLTLTSKALTGSIAAASATNAGTMSGADKLKLDAITGTNTGDQTITLQGDVTGSGTSTFTTALSTTGVAAGSYPKVTVDTKGRVTAGTTLLSADIPNNAANTTGTSANVTGIVAVANGGTGTSTGSITPTGNYSITQNSFAVVTSEATSAAANTLYLKQGSVGIGKVPTAKLDINGTASMTGFTMATGASNSYVLTSDANGVGTWQAAPSGSGGSLSGGTSNYIPLWSSSSAQTSSLLYQTGGQIGINKTTLGATLDVNGTGTFSGLLTASGGITMGGTLTMGGNPVNADTGKSVGSKVLTSTQAGNGFVDITGANLTASSQIFLSYRRPSIGTNFRTYCAAVTTMNTSTHTFRVSFAVGDFASGDTIYWMIIN